MIRPITLTSFAVALLLGFALFKVKYEVQMLENRLIQVQRQTALEQEAIHILRASWSSETRPQKLAELVDHHLVLKPMTPLAISSYDTLPLNERISEPQAPPEAIAALVPPDSAPIPASSAATPAPTVLASNEEAGNAISSLAGEAEDAKPATPIAAPVVERGSVDKGTGANDPAISPARPRHPGRLAAPKQIASLTARPGGAVLASATSAGGSDDPSIDAVLAAMQASTAASARASAPGRVR